MGVAHYGGGGLGDKCLRRIDRWLVMSGSVVWFMWEERRAKSERGDSVRRRERASCMKDKCKS